MAKCRGCDQEMAGPGVGCEVQAYIYMEDAEDIGVHTIQIQRIPNPAEEKTNCHDCNCPPGTLHHVGCDMERCPKCGGQFMEGFCCNLDCEYYAEEDYQP